MHVPLRQNLMMKLTGQNQAIHIIIQNFNFLKITKKSTSSIDIAFSYLSFANNLDSNGDRKPQHYSTPILIARMFL